MKIGEIMAADREITLNEGKKTVTVTVANKVWISSGHSFRNICKI